MRGRAMRYHHAQRFEHGEKSGRDEEGREVKGPTGDGYFPWSNALYWLFGGNVSGPGLRTPPWDGHDLSLSVNNMGACSNIQNRKFRIAQRVMGYLATESHRLPRYGCVSETRITDDKSINI